MAVENNIPRSTVGPPLGGYRQKHKPVLENAVFTMRDAHGDLHEVSRQNVGDMLKNHGWTHHVVATENDSETDETAPEKSASHIVQPEEKPAETDPAKMNVLEKLRYDYKNATGEDADKRWGKKSLCAKIANAAPPPPVGDDDT